MGRAIARTMQRNGLSASPVNAVHDKVTRFTPAAVRYREGQILHLATVEGLGDAEAEILSFNKGAHDDVVDTVAYAVIHANDIGIARANTPDEPRRRSTGIQPGMAM
jgi:predicted phage terminase large subunit-like protein